MNFSKKILKSGVGRIFTAPDYIDRTDKERLSIFLAGTIDNGESEDWQNEVIDAFNDLNVDIYNPRRSEWNPEHTQSLTNNELFRQIDWEHDAMEKADAIIMNFLPNSKSPITLLELGLFAKSEKIVVICPDEFYRAGNVHYICNKYDIPLYKNLKEMYEAE